MIDWPRNLDASGGIRVNIRVCLLVPVLVALAACAVIKPRVTGVEISRIGIINALPEAGEDVHRGTMNFPNKQEDLVVNWDFPALVFEKLKQRLSGRGVDVVDLTDDVDYSSNGDTLFETGFSLKFGLSPHVVSEKARLRLSMLMKKHNLDAIALLRPAGYNEGSPSGWPKDNTAAFGFYGDYGGPGRGNLQHTFVQIEARVIAGDPPKIIEDLHSSSLVKRGTGASGRSLSGSELKSRIYGQIKTAISEIVHGLGL